MRKNPGYDSFSSSKGGVTFILMGDFLSMVVLGYDSTVRAAKRKLYMKGGDDIWV